MESQFSANPTLQFGPLVEFFLSWGYNLLEPPVNGSLVAIHQMYCLNYEQCDLTQFLQHLDRINDICPSTFQFAVDYLSTISSCPIDHRLEWFNELSLKLLVSQLAASTAPKLDKHKLSNIAKKHNQSPLQTLISILDKPLYTKPCAELVDEGVVNYNKLSYYLNKPTAISKLAKQKIQLVTPKKQFYDICNNHHHSFYLSEVVGLTHSKRPVGTNTKPSNRDYKLNEHQKKILPSELEACYRDKIHYLPIIRQQTELGLGDCSYLDTCHKINNCRYLHYFNLMPESFHEKHSIEYDQLLENSRVSDFTYGDPVSFCSTPILPPQWINCDVRKIDFNVLGKFAAVIADPAWNIHMNLPYGTCKDSELLMLPMSLLQDEGIILLWVTGRSIEIGRESLINWGYKVANELIWIKINQLKRTICTGRTGHWLNHSKEHLLIGIKGNPRWLNKNIDPDVLVSSTRETSRKPDEIYGIVERLVGTKSRKLEIFGRDHNTRPGWFSKYLLLYHNCCVVLN